MSSAQFGYEQYLQAQAALRQQAMTTQYPPGYPQQPYPTVPPSLDFPPPTVSFPYHDSDDETTGKHLITTGLPPGMVAPPQAMEHTPGHIPVVDPVSDTGSAPAVVAATQVDTTPPNSAAAPQPTAPRTPRKSTVEVRNVAFFRVLRAESIKLRTLTSTWWLLAIAVILTIGMGALMGWTIKMAFENPESMGISPDMVDLFRNMEATTLATTGMQFMQLVVTILGVLYITNEYSSGSIRATLSAVPTRLVMVIAKAVNLGIAVFLTSMASLYAAAMVGWAFISGYGVDDRFTLSGLRAIAGASLANTLITLLAFAVGLLLRSTAGGIGTVLGVLLVLPIITQILPWDWATTTGEYLPGASSIWLYNFGDAAAANMWDWNQWGFLKGLWVTGAWALLPFIGGLAALKARDAGGSE
ncbi:MAG: ABC transporter permease [Propionibacteriaceae bacterium]|jgi:ABC-2 type transport system permease protein|nr:ABC transporter permease [Propionibacteriaceae bacterium]